MDEQTSWKSHGFTLLIFGGIVVLSGIFFVLGMLVGRTQGRQIAEAIFKERAANAPAAEAGENFPLKFHEETTGDKPDLRLEPAPPAPAPSPSKDSRPAMSAPRQESKASGKAASKPVVAKAKAPGVFLQVFATREEKKAREELKKVQSKGFTRAKILEVIADNVKWHRVVVGPYKESEAQLTISDLRAKGYKEVIIRK